MTDDTPAGGPAPRDIHNYLAEFDDIPGTRVFTAKRARKGYHLNQFAMSLMKADNRDRFRADEDAYLADWKLTPAAREAVLKRDYNAMLDEGGNIYFLAKLFSTDGKSFQFAAGSMTGMTQEDYAAMMVGGGRSPEGARSLKDNAAATSADEGKDNAAATSAGGMKEDR